MATSPHPPLSLALRLRRRGVIFLSPDRRAIPPWDTRLNRHSAHPDHGCGELYEAEEVDGSSVVACGEAAEVLELVEASLDAVAVFVDRRVVGDDDLARAVGRDHRLGSGVGDERPQGIAVIGFVGEDCLGIEAVDEGWCGEDVAALAGGE